MKILYVVGNPGLRIDNSVYTGSTSHIVNLIEAYRKLGHMVVPIIAGQGTRESQAKLSFSNQKYILPLSIASMVRDGYKIYYNYNFLSSYKSFFKREIPDFIYERYSYFFWASSTIARDLKIPHILEINAPIEARSRFGPAHFSFLASLIQRKVEKCTNAIITISGVMRDYLVKRGVPSRKIHVLPNGVDTELFDSSSAFQDIRNKYSLRGKIVIGFVGSMHKHHGVELLIRLAQDLIRERKELHFLVVGRFRDRRQFEENLKGRGVSEHFTLTGGIPFEAVPAHIAAMDICVMPNSNWNGSPIKIFEYGAMGKPVIAPRTAPVQEVIEDGKNGILINPGDAEDLKEKILILVNDSKLRKELGSKIMEHIRKHHTWKRNAERVIDIYRAIV